MARIRTIKPEFWQDYRMAIDLSRDDRLFYIGLWNEADDAGRFLAHPRRLLGAIFPYDDDIQESFIEDSLSRLAGSGRVVLYTVNGEPYGQLTKFRDHQRINRPSPSNIPAPDANGATIYDDSLNTHGTLTEDSPWEGKGKERKGKERMSESDKPIADPVSELWNIWTEELGGDPPQPKLSTGKRRAVLRSLFDEQLRKTDDPPATFRAICQAVKRSDHHMSDRAYQLPESLFLNPERRERWTIEALNPQTKRTGNGKQAPKQPASQYVPGLDD